jgi:EmrB/QacA subfamily drug resistance transporter
MPTFLRNPKATAMLGAMLAMLLAALDQTIVSTAMPQIVRELNGLEHLSWVFTAYMLASTVTVPLYGKLSDLYGRKPFYLAGIVLFLLGSILCGTAHSMFELILYRGVQGIGGGAIMVNSFALVGELFSPRERGRWQGLLGAMWGLSSVLGPLLGGWITDSATWRWVFYINIPLGLLALAVIYFFLPSIGNHKGSKVDYLGGVLIGMGVTPLLLALVWGGSTYPWGSATVLSLFALSAALLAAFVFVESRAEDPVLPMRFFKNPAFTVSVGTVFLTAIGMFGSIVYLPLFAQNVLHTSATGAGLVLTPMMLGIVFASTLSGQVVSRTGKYKWLAVGGVALATVGMYLFSQMSTETTYLELVRNMVVMGLGLGTTFPIFNIVIQSAFGAQFLGVTTASVQLFRSVGATVGTALLGGLFNYGMKTQHLDFTQSLTQVFFIGTFILGGAVALCLFLPQIHLATHKPKPEELVEF